MDTFEARGPKQLSKEYLERARELRPMLAAAGDAIERGREVTPEIVAAMKERGIFRMLQPRSIGGAELDPLTYTAVLEELARGDGSTAWCLGQNSGCSMIAPYLPAESAREIFGDLDGILAWGPELPGAGRGVAVEGGYRVTGQWGFATGSRHASWLGCHVPLFEKDGSPRLLPERAPAGAHDGVSEIRGRDHRQLAGARACAAPAATATASRTISCRRAHRRARQRGRTARDGAALPVHQRHDLRDELLARVDGHCPRRARRLYRNRAGQGAARRQGHAAREQRDPVAGRAMRRRSSNRRAPICAA